ncbi:lipopolysaccharide biosynthesis protein [Pseudonocardia sp. WMMC193]|uniref:lipopolysaccharide biosynthesis protein n=1 Tax=Pseudonocardia sp. WMMC193 TaxID=2911965 RepID=UPI001F19638A|nr:oligosaccharide flippase family protein [Pseudonocardia sp. WMMC193]MCF7553811.1 oligosaccharide flippase family protein [Pseudonocardia sp. WMMC193]
MSETTVELAAKPAGGGGGLFGRGLLYVVVWSAQLVGSTLISPVLAHLLGPTDFGELASAIALHQILLILAVVGIDQALVQQRAEDGDDLRARGLITVGLAVATVVTAVVWTTGPLWSAAAGFSGFSSLLVATVLWTVPAGGVQLALGLLVAQDRFRAFAVVSGLAAIGGQVFGLGLVAWLGPRADVYAWGGVISQFAALAVGLALVRPRLHGLLDRRTAWAAARFGLPLAVSMVFMFVLNAGDRVVIQRMLGAAEVGRYQIAYTVGFVVTLLVGFTSQAWMPRIAGIRDRAARLRTVAWSRDESYLLVLPVVLGITVAAPTVLRIVAPAEFAPSTLVELVFLVAVCALPSVAAAASGKVLFTERRTRPLLVVAAVAATANMLLTVVLLPVLGITGAALATLAAFLLQAGLQHRAVPRAPRLARTPVWVLATVFGVCLIGWASTHLPQTGPWEIGRWVLTAACVAWFLQRLRASRTASPPDAHPAGPADSPTVPLPRTPS